MAESEAITEYIRKAAAGDPEASSWLWHKYRGLLYTIAQGFHSDLRNPANDTSDIVADASMQIFNSATFAKIKDRKHFINTVRQIIHNDTIDQLRKDVLRQTDEYEDTYNKNDLDFLNAEMEILLCELPASLYETAKALMYHENERDAAKELGVTLYEVQKRKQLLKLELEKILEKKI